MNPDQKTKIQVDLTYIKEL